MAQHAAIDGRKTKLTTKGIQAARYAGRRTSDGNWTRDVRWDSEVRGLGLRVLPSEERVFIIMYRHHGRKRLMTLGRFGTITLDEARRRARKALGAVDEGRDPLDERDRERRAGTMAELCAEYLRDHAAQKKSGKKDESYINRFILKRWSAVKAKAIIQQDVAALVRSIGLGAEDEEGTPYQANRVLEVVRVIFNFGKARGYLDPDQENPAKGVSRFQEVSRKRRLSREELPKLIEALQKEGDPHIRGLFWLYLFTGCRKTELLNAKWEDVRWEPGTLVIPNTRSGEPHEVPLTKEAVQLLRDLQGVDSDRAKGNPYVFPGHVANKPLVNIDKAWSRIREAAGVTDVHIHDLRRTVGSWLADEGHSLHLVGKVLNHKSTKTTEVYARLSDETVREALAAHGRKLAAIGSSRVAVTQASRDEKRGSKNG